MNRNMLASMILVSAVSAAAQAGLVDNTTVTILASSSPAFPAYPQSDALDVGSNQYFTDYSSSGLGTSTHLDFQFPTPEKFTQIQYTDRTTSGGANGGFVGGTTNYVTSYEYQFATDALFTNIVGTVTPALRTTPAPTTTLASFQETDAIGSIVAQYVRFQVLTANGPNTGAANFQFTVVPEPGALVLFGIAAAGLFLAAWNRR